MTAYQLPSWYVRWFNEFALTCHTYSILHLYLEATVHHLVWIVVHELRWTARVQCSRLYRWRLEIAHSGSCARSSSSQWEQSHEPAAQCQAIDLQLDNLDTHASHFSVHITNTVWESPQAP